MWTSLTQILGKLIQQNEKFYVRIALIDYVHVSTIRIL